MDTTTLNYEDPTYPTEGPPAGPIGDDSVPPPPADEPGRIRLQELSETLNGYDQLAIRARFHERFDQLAEDPLMFARAMYFIHLRRTSGQKDSESFNQAMGLTMKALNEMFDSGEDDDVDPEDESAVAERDRQYADFVIGTGVSYTLDQFMELTIQQRSKMIEAANRR